MTTRTLAVLSLLLAASVLPTTRASAQNAFSLGVVSDTTCSRTTVDITASNLSPSLGLDFDVSYDQTLMVASQVTLGALTAGCTTPAVNLDPPGLVRISMACVPAVSGSGVVATITFDPIGPGASSVNFTKCWHDEVDCTPTNGSVTISGCPTIAVSPASPSGIAALAGTASFQGRACVGARLTPNAASVAATTSNLTFDSRFVFEDGSCTMNANVSALGKVISTQLTPGNPNSTLRVTVSGGASLLPSGPIFVCTFRTPIAATLPLGTYPFTNISSAADAAAAPIGAVSGNGQVTVTTCNGDCNASGGVEIGEVVRALNEFGGTPLCNPADPLLSCPVADSDNSGAVAIGEVIQSLNRFGQGCP